VGSEDGTHILTALGTHPTISSLALSFHEQDLPQLILQTQYGNFPGWWGVLEAATGGTLPKSDAEFEGTRYGGAYEAKAPNGDEE
jgi:hypothetical protein